MDQNNQIGFITKVNHYLVKVEGLPQAKINEIVTTESGNKGVVIGLDTDSTNIMMLDTADLKGGVKVQRTGQSFSIPVGSFLLGRIVNTLGLPIDGKANFAPNAQRMEIFKEG